MLLSKKKNKIYSVNFFIPTYTTIRNSKNKCHIYIKIFLQNKNIHNIVNRDHHFGSYCSNMNKLKKKKKKKDINAFEALMWMGEVSLLL